jgi:anti-sigma regulatory factor (Ser/Thr protein kinase)
MLRRPDGTIDLLSDGGLPLGLRHLTKERGRTIRFEPGSVLVLYTDGLTEASRRPVDGEEALRKLLRDGEFLKAAHPARALKSAFFDGASAKDDVAILVFGIAAPVSHGNADHEEPIQRWFFDAADAQAAQCARKAFTDGLRARAADEECIHRAELVFGELVGNAARYARGPIEVSVDWSCAAPVLHVLDNGPGFHHVPALPRDVYSESGRGLFIISLLSEEFSVSKRPEHGSHARAVLSLHRRPFGRSKGKRPSLPAAAAHN